ncbi:GDSL-like Lipase/Acylhydrolase [Colletotrichum scovillei]|uniref:GDSL-like Lipase/Acylhydrolase n=1 Tax=Colletotrichum scovillei TaxID=1209932 RepID=A0A9P7UJI2_9PEZI|nr:GDSL-like Lipase/Acylhydrolase [Colletotrichum scovillei]KAF4777666.1 GDSL-like Lipase/Acylhydrolase [Colletotrichum scovillei]KAG7058962.1 GDSL-like Lipase/Acylhydrolase [Colletotrichum scovillei]KAG7077613.1 GDSL-like Lipase/Acylhydrolase [Colletotrichum scovillei]KAG7084669.1 GDSL-like Lipase/Acylhydrolase [Colletotrichum scovillei]
MASHAPLRFKGVRPGQGIKPGTTLRILGVGDSITVGFLSDIEGGDGNGYRLKLREDLSKDRVVFAGTETMHGTMREGYYAAWNGMTIKFMSDNIGPSLAQRPNIVLIHAGTNDMNPNPDVAREGSEPHATADRLGHLIDQVVQACPDATVLVAKIIGCYDPVQMSNIAQFNAVIHGVVQARQSAGKHVLTVDFSSFPMNALRDGIHPTNQGYRLFGDYWYDFITQIPSDWIKEPVGDDPRRSGELRRDAPVKGRSTSLCDRLFGLFFGREPEMVSKA